MSFEGYAIVTVEENNYRTNFLFRTKREAVDKMKNVDLSKRRRQLRLQRIYLF